MIDYNECRPHNSLGIAAGGVQAQVIRSSLYFQSVYLTSELTHRLVVAAFFLCLAPIKYKMRYYKQTPNITICRVKFHLEGK